ncbi:MAG: hypothetical protein DMF62_11720 [Acidobacteria bacterium]|nr:MAG: hypothetical protein DMF62_11720 [Acidobacteriota bacterium]
MTYAEQLNALIHDPGAKDLHKRTAVALSNMDPVDAYLVACALKTLAGIRVREVMAATNRE